MVKTGPKFDPGNRLTKTELMATLQKPSSAPKGQGDAAKAAGGKGAGGKGGRGRDREAEQAAAAAAAVASAVAGSGGGPAGDAAAPVRRAKDRSPPRARGGPGATLTLPPGAVGGDLSTLARTAPPNLGRASLRPEQLTGSFSAILPGKSLPRRAGLSALPRCVSSSPRTTARSLGAYVLQPFICRRSYEIPMTRVGTFRTERPLAAAHRLRCDEESDSEASKQLQGCNQAQCACFVSLSR